MPVPVLHFKEPFLRDSSDHVHNDFKHNCCLWLAMLARAESELLVWAYSWELRPRPLDTAIRFFPSVLACFFSCRWGERPGHTICANPRVVFWD